MERCVALIPLAELPWSWQDDDLRHAAILAAPRPIPQRGSHDCGVACVAMAAKVPYETVHSAFCSQGLDAPSKRGRRGKPFSSNFNELKAVLSVLGLSARVRRFVGWDGIVGPSIVKVRSTHKRDWHWVYANRDAVYGLQVLDPARFDVYLDRFPPGMSGVTLEAHFPYGSFLELCG